MSIELSKQAKELKLGQYYHFKGRSYEVIGVAHHSETNEELVVYKKLYDDFGIWVRPLNMFTEEVEFNGQRVQRFTYIAEYFIINKYKPLLGACIYNREGL